ncbi:hypothetical protein C5167_038815 [Papaver somniferum]|uniref:Proteasome alpha-type subunits domain-containing protein n=1 Tax=Papaver somniferum TaxID=3469 RepID=A0A4Y7IDP5_PAPSO|nr:hypothetical protein C5167_038815 [Papaver somniferum]
MVSAGANECLRLKRSLRYIPWVHYSKLGDSSDEESTDRQPHQVTSKWRPEDAQSTSQHLLMSRTYPKITVCTQRSWKRPYGVGMLVAGLDESGAHLYYNFPNGNYFEYQAFAIGARSQSAKTCLEREFESFANSTRDDLIKYALFAIKETLQGEKLTSSICTVDVVSLEEDFHILDQKTMQEFIELLEIREEASVQEEVEVPPPAPMDIGDLAVANLPFRKLLRQEYSNNTQLLLHLFATAATVAKSKIKQLAEQETVAEKYRNGSGAVANKCNARSISIASKIKVISAGFVNPSRCVALKDLKMGMALLLARTHKNSLAFQSSELRGLHDERYYYYYFLKHDMNQQTR